MSATGRRGHAGKPRPAKKQVPIPTVDLGPLVPSHLKGPGRRPGSIPLPRTPVGAVRGPSVSGEDLFRGGSYEEGDADCETHGIERRRCGCAAKIQPELPAEAQHARDPDDDYATPEWCLDAIWPHVRPVSGVILDPCAGAGAVLKFLAARYDRKLVNGCEIDRARCDAAAEHAWCQHGDWLADDEPRTYRGAWPKLILTNPPYRLAMPFVEKSLRMVRPVGGTVAMLLRVNWLSSQERADWMRAHTPDANILPKRPSFKRIVRFHLVEPRTGGKVATDASGRPYVFPEHAESDARRLGATYGYAVRRRTTSSDATEYAWMVWAPARKQRLCILELPKTATEEDDDE